MAFGQLSQPPVGSGTYAQWVIFVVIVMLSVFLATIIGHTVGLGRK